jgi:hypothetical protein
VAPTARRMPISRVRSVPETSMMFTRGRILLPEGLVNQPLAIPRGTNQREGPKRVCPFAKASTPLANTHPTTHPNSTTPYDTTTIKFVICHLDVGNNTHAKRYQKNPTNAKNRASQVPLRFFTSTNTRSRWLCGPRTPGKENPGPRSPGGLPRRASLRSGRGDCHHPALPWLRLAGAPHYPSEFREQDLPGRGRAPISLRRLATNRAAFAPAAPGDFPITRLPRARMRPSDSSAASAGLRFPWPRRTMSRDARRGSQSCTMVPSSNTLRPPIYFPCSS